jgi:GNAT superfamily N-acetyltransferase
MASSDNDMFKIDIADAQDLDRINRLIQAIHEDQDSYYKPPYPLYLENIKRSKNRVTFISKTNGQIIGYLILHSDCSFQDDNSAEVEQMGVHPAHKRQGNGISLLLHSYQFLIEKTKANHLTSRVSKGNLKAKNLHEKAEFFPCHEDKMGWYMCKPINR